MSDGHVIQPPPDPLVGTVVGARYHIERRLGEGGMGAVYLAQHVVLEKTVALKVLHQDYSRRPDLVERFLHEAKAASRIRHEHVIDITDFGQTESGNVFFAMEFLEGCDLAHEITTAGSLPWPRALEIMRQLCSALQAAHDVGVVHRDLKPANIFLISRLERSDYVKVLDFGIAKLTDLEETGQKLTRTGMVFGTPEYMSPEQARGDKPDRRVDVYAAGCILFEMLTGTVPYQGDSFMAILTKHLFDPIPDISALLAPGTIPAGLPEVLVRAMAKDRGQRFPEMSELGLALEALSSAAPEVAPPRAVTPTATVVSHEARPKRSVGLRLFAICAVLAVVSGTIAYWIFKPTPRVRESLPVKTPPAGKETNVVETHPFARTVAPPPQATPALPQASGEAPVDRGSPVRMSPRKGAPAEAAARPPEKALEKRAAPPLAVVTPPDEDPAEAPKDKSSEIKDPFAKP